jgi:hypothetical protein
MDVQLEYSTSSLCGRMTCPKRDEEATFGPAVHVILEGFGEFLGDSLKGLGTSSAEGFETAGGNVSREAGGGNSPAICALEEVLEVALEIALNLRGDFLA